MKKRNLFRPARWSDRSQWTVSAFWYAICSGQFFWHCRNIFRPKMARTPVSGINREDAISFDFTVMNNIDNSVQFSLFFKWRIDKTHFIHHQ